MNSKRFFVKSKGIFAAVALSATAMMFAGCGKAEQSEPASGAQNLEDFKFSDAKDIAMSAPPPVQAVAPGTVLATVNGDEITQAELNREFMGFASRSPQPMPPEQMQRMLAQMTPQILDSLIVKSLLMAAVEDEKVELTDEEYEEGVGTLTAQLPPGATMDEHLQNLGMTADEFKEALSLDLKINKMIKAKLENLNEPSEEEVTAFYEENKERFVQPEQVTASHILIGFEPTDDDAAKAEKKAKIEAIRTQIEEGADFEALAGQESTCPSKARGGSLGSFGRGQMVKPFEEAAFSQEIGEVGPVVETRFGYHIIKVTEHTQPDELEFEDVKERISDGLMAQGRQKGIQEYLEELKSSADIKYSDDSLKPPANPMMGMGQPR